MPETIIAPGLAETLGSISVDELKSALEEQLRALSDYANSYPWIHSIYEKQLVVSSSGKYYRHNYSVKGSAVTLSASREEVRMTWTADAVTVPVAVTESRRNRGAYIKQEGGLREAIEPTAPNDAGISEGCVLLRAGTNKSGRRYYTPEFIQAHLDRFDGALCHMDHPTVSEGRERPERTMGTLAAVVRNPRWSEAVAEGGSTAGAAIGDLEYLDTDAGRNMRAAFANAAVREAAGLSIFWAGPVKVARRKLAESTVDVPLELLGEGKLNVDFVTRPNAGGRVAPLKESEADMDSITLEMLEAERPDLIEAARQGYVKQPEPDKQPEKPQPQTGMSEAERTEFEALKQRARRADAQDVVNAVIAEAGLSEPLAAEVRAQFGMSECSDPEQFKPLVVAAADRLKKLAESLQPKRVIGNGAEPKAQGGTVVDVNAVMSEAHGYTQPEK